MRRFVAPVAVSALFILWTPFIGDVRDALRRLLPDRFVLVVGGTVVLLVAVAVVTALVRIGTARLPRYGALATALGLFAIWLWKFRTGQGEVDAVELVHFVEYGLVALLFYRAVHPLADPSVVGLTLLYGTLVGTLEEWVQWFVPTRVGEARDVALNLYAVGCGLLFGLGWQPPVSFTWRLSAPARRRLLRFAAVVLVLLAAFVDCAHLGHEIRDPEIGRFRSFFTASELLALRDARAVEWRLRPPTRLPRLGKEDYYLTEGGWHAQARNEAYARQAFDVAWRENRILEKYFTPFLDLRSFTSGQLHRWPPEQHAEVEAGRAGARGADYLSPAGGSRVAIWPPRTVFWTVVLTLAVGLVVGSLERRRPRAAR